MQETTKTSRPEHKSGENFKKLNSRQKCESLRKKLHYFFITAIQTCYLSTFFYVENDLNICAAACAFGFLFSFIPVTILILGILISFVHATPDIVSNFLELTSLYSDFISFISIEDILNAINKISGSSVFEILVVISIFWMARRFFAAVMLSMKKIFHGVVKNRPVISQFFILAGEILLVLFMAIVILVFASAKTILSFSIFGFLKSYLPAFYSNFSQKFVYTMPYLLCCFFIAVLYRTASGIRPKRLLCFFSAFCCTAFFWITVHIMAIFLNISRYNLVYGVLSRLIVLLLEVYILFIYILFFAQFIFVVQYLDNLLLGELYLLSETDNKTWPAKIKQKIFSNTDFIIRHKEDFWRSCGNSTEGITEQIVFLEKGKIIFTEQEVSDAVYYIVNGSVKLVRGTQVSLREKGQFFGETGCVFNVARKGEAITLENCELLRIPAKKFWELIDSNPRITEKVLSHTSEYFRNLYGRNGSFLL